MMAKEMVKTTVFGLHLQTKDICGMDPWQGDVSIMHDDVYGYDSLASYIFRYYTFNFDKVVSFQDKVYC